MTNDTIPPMLTPAEALAYLAKLMQQPVPAPRSDGRTPTMLAELFTDPADIWAIACATGHATRQAITAQADDP